MRNLFKCFTVFSALVLSIFMVQASNLYTNTGETRKKMAFNEGWEFRKAEKDTCYCQAEKLQLCLDGWRPRTTGNDTPGEWEKVTVPHTWNHTDMQTQRNDFYAGKAYYKKTYLPDAALDGKRLFLRFEGVSATAEVFVNNQIAGTHLGGYSAFVVEISNLVKYGEENEILVMVDNSSRPDVIPVNHRLFGVYGGIYRPVELLITENINIAVNDYASPGIAIRQENVTNSGVRVLFFLLRHRYPSGKRNRTISRCYSDHKNR